MAQYEKHVFVCTSGPYCWFDGDTDSIFGRLKKLVAGAGRRDRIRVNRSGCLNHCGHGPMIVVYPDGIWYGGVDADGVEEIFEQHLCRDLPVERLQLHLPPGNNKQTQDYPAEVHQMKRVEKELDERRTSARAAIVRQVSAAARSSQSAAQAREQDAAPSDADKID